MSLDAIDIGAFRWIDDALGMYARVLKDCDVLLNNAVPKDLQSQVALDDLKYALYMHSEEALFIGRHYFQALQMRQCALKYGDLTWYCAASYALCHNWGTVLDSIDWLAWGGGGSLADRPVQALVVLVAGCGGVSCTRLKDALGVMAPGKEEETLQRAQNNQLIRWVEQTKRYELGSQAPRPYAF